MTDEEKIKRAINEAHDDAFKRGRNAAEWYMQETIGGHARGDTKERARNILAGIESGDPEVMDSFPYPNLSGEYADDPTPQSVIAEFGPRGLEEPLTPGDEEEIIQAWEEGASDGFLSTLEKGLREEVEG